jgi:hypothetical protein
MPGDLSSFEAAADIDLIKERLPTRRVTVQVQPVRHRDGRSWNWLTAVNTVRAGCDTCHPGVPCWRHDAVAVELVHLTSAVHREARGCHSDRHGGSPGSHPVPPTGGVHVQHHDGGEWDLCPTCAIEAIGPVRVATPGAVPAEGQEPPK